LAVRAGEVAIPLALVVAFAVMEDPNRALGPLDGAVNVTAIPLTGFPAASVTLACSAEPNAALMTAICGVPPVAEIVAAAPARLVREKYAGVAAPVTLATTEKLPAWVLAVSIGAVAMPFASVIAVAAAAAPNLAVAPLTGAANVTVAPLTAFPPESLTMACNGIVNALPIAAACGVPPVALMLPGEPTVLLKLNVAGVPTPVTDAVTVYDPA
jgi:hypothetical protein